MSWNYEFEPASERDLSRLDHQGRRDVLDQLDALMLVIDGPHQPPPGIKLLRHIKPLTWRLRVGDWRVSYPMDRQTHLVRVLAVKHRSEIYER